VTRRRLLVAAIVIGAAAAVAACSLLVPLDEVQCNTAADCIARGPSFAGAACVSNVCTLADAGDAGQVPEAAPDSAPEAAIDASGPWGCLQLAPGASDPGVTIQLEIIAFDPFQPYTLGGAVDGGNDLQVIQATRVPGVAVQPCATLDPACANPVAPAVLTDDAGLVSLSINGGFDGFYSMKRSDAFPTLFYPGRLLASEPSISFPSAILPYTVANEIGAAIGISVSTDPDAGVGHIFSAIFDCDDLHAAGVALAINSDAGTQFYQANGLPTTSASHTDGSGTSGWLNVPAGSVTIQATIEGQTLQLPPYTVYVRPASETLVYLRSRSRNGP
jgi:hypothetical protein